MNLANRLPLNIYVDGIERILSGATLLRGEHVERDIRFLRAAGVRIEDQVVARSVMVERHKRLASGIGRPHAHREPGLPAHPGGMNKPSLTRNKPIHHPSAVKRENRECQPYKRVRPTAATADRRPSATAEATS